MRVWGWRLEVDIVPQCTTSMSNEFRPAGGRSQRVTGISAVVLSVGHDLPIPGVTRAMGARSPREEHKNEPHILLLWRLLRVCSYCVGSRGSAGHA